MNWLAQRVDTEFFALLGQDDLVDPTYYERLIAGADTNPNAVVVYSDVKWFGAENFTREEPEIIGSPVERMLAQIARCCYLPFFGVWRAGIIARAGELAINDYESVLEDVIWVTKILQMGDVHRIPFPLYSKRLHSRAVTMRCNAWEPEFARQGWIDTWVRFFEVTLRAADTAQSVHSILSAVLYRVAVSAPDMSWLYPIENLSKSERKHLITDFLAAVRKHETIDLPKRVGMNWDLVQREALRNVDVVSELCYATTAHLHRELSRRLRAIEDLHAEMHNLRAELQQRLNVLARVSASCDELQVEHSRLESEFHGVLQSRSWRITSPLRIVSAALRRFAQARGATSPADDGRPARVRNGWWSSGLRGQSARAGSALGILRRQDSQRRKTGRPSRRAADQIRAGDQPLD